MEPGFSELLQAAIRRQDSDEWLGLEQEMTALELSGVTSFEDLCAVARDPQADAELRQSACWFLGLLDDSRAVLSVIAALDAEDPKVRSEAARVVGYLQDPQGLTPLLALLRDPVSFVRGGSVEGLRCLGDQRAVEALTRLFEDEQEDDDVRREAAWALEWLRDPPA